MNASALIDRLLRADMLRQLVAQRGEIDTLLTPRCGNCEHWMKSRTCPREHNVDGMTRGPSCNALPCPQHAMTPSTIRVHAEKVAANEAAIAALH